MENIKKQIEELKTHVSYINSTINKLEQQVNKPKIEVGKVYDIQFNIQKNNNYILGYIVEVKGEYATYFGLTDNGWKTDFFRIDNAYSIKESTKEEWETALTKHADKLYEGVEKVDRSGMDILWSDIESFKGHLSTVWNGKEFQYKGIFVMDKHGVWAKPVIEEKEMFVNVHLVDGDNSCGTIYYDASEAKNSTTGVFKHLGVFKLVKVG